MESPPRKSATRRSEKSPDRAALRRAVASSTAIETGQSIAQIERTLRANRSKFRNLKLAR